MTSRPDPVDVPDAVLEIARRLEDAGHETWTVGGAVRDALLGHPRVDWDLATAARPETVMEIFRRAYPIGIEFGTVGVRGRDDHIYEVTTFRRDIATDGRHAVVEYADDLDEDLARRDFTINAIAYHPFRDEWRDPFGGRGDLERRRLRCVGRPGDRFAEDYLRILRGLRFAGRLELEIEPETWAALTEAVPSLPRLSGERVREELLKVLESPVPSRSLDLYRRSGALERLIPELDVDDDDWPELMRTIDGLTVSRPRLRLAALFLAAGPDRETAMRRLRFSNDEIRDAEELGRAAGLDLPAADDLPAARRWIRDVGRGRARDGLRLHFARARARDDPPAARTTLTRRARSILAVLRRGDPVTVGDLAIDGEDLKRLGLRPGPEFAEILEDCLDRVIERPARNTRAHLLDHVRTEYVE